MSQAPTVLFVDDEPHVRMAARQTLELEGYPVRCLERAEPALDLLSADWPGILVSDVRMPQMDGLELLRRTVELDPQLPVVLITGHGDIAMAVQAMRDGAYDFLEKPFSAEHLVDVVRRALDKRTLVMENRALRSEIDRQTGLEARIIGKAPEVERLRQVLTTVAATDADVLIHGETGTGKELVARSLHDLSPRRNRPFVAVNCGAMPESIFESELFGHEPGAFTGAAKRRVGKFEYADGGTFFLDEIESMPLNLQVKLLRVLQERHVERLGSNEPVPIDIRVVAATKRDLREAAGAGDFREDLYYRLNVVTVEIPALRERRDDVPLLFQHFVARACARYRRDPPALMPQAVAALITHGWPGNVRELQNVAERYALGLGDPAAILRGGPSRGPEPQTLTLTEQVERFERCLLEQELRRQEGNIKATYEALGLPRKTLYDKMRKYGLAREQYLQDDGG